MAIVWMITGHTGEKNMEVPLEGLHDCTFLVSLEMSRKGIFGKYLGVMGLWKSVSLHWTEPMAILVGMGTLNIRQRKMQKERLTV